MTKDFGMHEVGLPPEVDRVAARDRFAPAPDTDSAEAEKAQIRLSSCYLSSC